MNIVRTPTERFVDLVDYPFEPHYVDITHTDGSQLRFHYVDEGDRDGEIILCLHGQPSWSYLYRKMIPLLTAGGHRVIAPDLIGFGKSDKPTDSDAYTYSNHTAWVKAFMEALALKPVTLMCQDWGALIGLRLVGLHPEKFARVVSANGPLPSSHVITTEMTQMMEPMYQQLPVPNKQDLKNAFRNYSPTTFLTWMKYCVESPDFSPRDVMQMSIRGVTESELDAYMAPFPGEEYMVGTRRFPELVPLFPQLADELAINDKAWEGLRAFDKPFITAFADHDPVTAGAEVPLQKFIPGAMGQAHTTLNGGHFIQDDNPEDLCAVILKFMQDNPVT